MIAIVVLAGIALAMAVLDPHPVEAGKSQTLLAKAAYPKVYVHFVGGLALAALIDPHLLSDYWLLVSVAVIGALYEGVQWFNIRGTKRGGVFTVAEAIAVAAGALVLIAVKHLPLWI